MENKAILLVFSLLIIMACNPVICSQRYKTGGLDSGVKTIICDSIIDENKELLYIEKEVVVYPIQIPVFDIRNKKREEDQIDWFELHDYKKIKEIEDGNINENTKFPIMIRRSLGVPTFCGFKETDVYFINSWVSAEEKEKLERQADRTERRSQQNFMQNMIESLFYCFSRNT
ncbi:MAG: hypothetical protein JO129_03280 [Candidatus Dependentiae bacterium]|nr:hypothetical protein [Candidatus Dependentiae bacterium]